MSVSSGLFRVETISGSLGWFDKPRGEDPGWEHPPDEGTLNFMRMGAGTAWLTIASTMLCLRVRRNLGEEEVCCVIDRWSTGRVRVEP